jgi:hypothetical protein
MRRFQVGDMVTYGPGARSGAPSGPFEIKACLPREDHATEQFYRIKSPSEPTERVVAESLLRSWN